MDIGTHGILRDFRNLPFAPAPMPVAAPRQRAKLWELNGSVHCSVIGTCLTTAELRRVMGRLARGDISHLSDHALHGEAVTLCGQHGIGGKLLQKALDQRHQAIVKKFAALRGETAVMTGWAEARRAGDIQGAYWAVLTHPDIGHDGMRQAFGDVHMLSHLVGAANRADIRRLASLEAENAALTEKVGRQQARLAEAITSRDRTIRELGLLAAARVGEVSAVQGDGDGAEDALAALRHLVGDLQARLAAETGRRERLEHRFSEISGEVRRLSSRAEQAEATAAALTRELLLLESGSAGAEQAVLPAQCVLYVGGRPGCVAKIRGVLAEAGGALLSHDGGRDESPALLPGLISRADIVVFPVDCVSHDAALTVKRVCRQLGKPWSPLRSSGVASFLAALAGEPTISSIGEITP